MTNILFCGNNGVFDGMLTCALSIMKRTESKEPFTFYVFTMDVSHIDSKYKPVNTKQIDFFSDVIKDYNPENRAGLVDGTQFYNEEFADCPNEDAYCSPYTLIRLFADRVEELPDKVLYLDIDIMFNRDIHLLYDIDVTGYEYAAARDHYGKYLIQPNYVNAGVILFNMHEIRKTGLLRKARELIKQKKLPFADQSAIIRSTTRKKMLPQKFNDQKYLHRHTVVRHFSKKLFFRPYPHTDNIKQWHIDRVHKVFKYHQFDDVFEEYLELKAKFEKENSN